MSLLGPIWPTLTSLLTTKTVYSVLQFGYVEKIYNQTLNTTFNGFMCETETWTYRLEDGAESGNITVMMETTAPNGTVLAVSQEYNITLGMYYLRKLLYLFASYFINFISCLNLNLE